MSDKQKLSNVADIVNHAIDHYRNYLYYTCGQKQVDIQDVVIDLLEIQTIINEEE